MAMQQQQFDLVKLPEDLLLQVLIRTPLKHLIQLRCTCNFFLDLFNNPKLISLYKLQSKTNPSSNHHLSIFTDTITSSPPPQPDQPTDLSNLWRFHISFRGSNYLYLKKHNQLIPFRSPNNRPLISSSNGLIRLSGGEIFNIFAGVYYHNRLLCYRAQGFDPISNDYKFFSLNGYDSVSIFSMKTNSWRTILENETWSELLDNHYGVWDTSEGSNICINGVIYWRPKLEKHQGRVDYKNGEGILSFDLHREEFIVFKSPDGLLTPQYSSFQLLSFRGCLCFASMKRYRKGSGSVDGGVRVDLFILKNNGGGGAGGNNEGEEVDNAWIRESIVPPFSPPKEVQIVSCCDEIFLGWFESKQLRLYNLKTKCVYDLPLSPHPSDYYPKVSNRSLKSTYVDNLRFDFSLNYLNFSSS